MDINNAIRSAFEHYRAGNLHLAMQFCQEIIAIHPDNIHAIHMLATISYRQKDYDSAIKYSEKLIRLTPDNAQIYYILGHCLQEKGEMDEAITYYQKSLQLNPNFFNAYYNLGTIFQDKKQYDESISCYQKTLHLNPNDVDALYNLGRVLQEKEQFDEAITCYQRALYFNPNLADAYNNLGILFQEKGQLDNAIPCYQKALLLDSNLPDAHFNMSWSLLLLGNFKQGWQEYEWRWKTEDTLQGDSVWQPFDFSQPLWDGSSLEGKSILIFAEQGVGDEIMFASCFQEVIEQARVCFIECDKRLIPIFARSFPKAILIERVKKTDDASSLHCPQTDTVIPIGSLPKILRPYVGVFQQKNYLIADTDKCITWRNRLRALGEGLNIGISWRGGGKPIVIRKRTITLEMWASLFSLSGINFINLQYGECKDELKAIEENLGIIIHDWEDANPLEDLDNFASQIASLDLVISVDNSTVHMAGALGVPVWTLLPFVPDWRWMLHREDSPWYPTMRLFRQPSPGDWKSVMARVAEELQKLVSSKT
jgi:tetratricopeptide (TPR) repeat protein